MHIQNFIFKLFYLNFIEQDRDKLQRHHLGDTVEELKRYNARRKLKGAVQAVAGGIAMDPLYGTDTDTSKYSKINFLYFLYFSFYYYCSNNFTFTIVNYP